jgi:hypothetical protein
MNPAVSAAIAAASCALACLLLGGEAQAQGQGLRLQRRSVIRPHAGEDDADFVGRPDRGLGSAEVDASRRGAAPRGCRLTADA